MIHPATTRRETFPSIDKKAIAEVLAAFPLHEITPGIGQCYAHHRIAQRLLADLGYQTTMVHGTFSLAISPEDFAGYMGPRGIFVRARPGRNMQGHIWLRSSDGCVLDFTTSGLRDICEGDRKARGLPPRYWHVDPSRYVWADPEACSWLHVVRGTRMRRPPSHEPGTMVYCQAGTGSAGADRPDVEEGINALYKRIAPTLIDGCVRYDEMLRAATSEQLKKRPPGDSSRGDMQCP